MAIRHGPATSDDDDQSENGDEESTRHKRKEVNWIIW